MYDYTCICTFDLVLFMYSKHVAVLFFCYNCNFININFALSCHTHHYSCPPPQLKPV